MHLDEAEQRMMVEVEAEDGEGGVEGEEGGVGVELWLPTLEWHCSSRSDGDAYCS